MSIVIGPLQIPDAKIVGADNHGKNVPIFPSLSQDTSSTVGVCQGKMGLE